MNRKIKKLLVAMGCIFLAFLCYSISSRMTQSEQKVSLCWIGYSFSNYAHKETDPQILQQIIDAFQSAEVSPAKISWEDFDLLGAICIDFYTGKVVDRTGSHDDIAPVGPKIWIDESGHVYVEDDFFYLSNGKEIFQMLLDIFSAGERAMNEEINAMYPVN